MIPLLENRKLSRMRDYIQALDTCWIKSNSRATYKDIHDLLININKLCVYQNLEDLKVETFGRTAPSAFSGRVESPSLQNLLEFYIYVMNANITQSRFADLIKKPKSKKSIIRNGVTAKMRETTDLPELSDYPVTEIEVMIEDWGSIRKYIEKMDEVILSDKIEKN